MDDPRWINYVRYMRRGEFELAWQISDAVLRERLEQTACDGSHLESCLWNGTPLEGKHVFIHCHHGLGDTIQFIRYARLVKRLASEVTVVSPRSLMGLLERVSGIDRILAIEDCPPDYERDVDVEVMELPYIFRTVRQTIPASVPYIDTDADAALRGDENFSVGIIWRGGSWDRRRDIPFPLLTILPAISGVAFYSLQKDPGPDERHGLITQAVDANADVLATARIMRSLDLVITVDSMPAHLAGALAVPTWTLLHSDPDWRWIDGDYSPWYPTMRLFCQGKAGEWQPVMAKIFDELSRLSGSSKNHHVSSLDVAERAPYLSRSEILD